MLAHSISPKEMGPKAIASRPKRAVGGRATANKNREVFAEAPFIRQDRRTASCGALARDAACEQPYASSPSALRSWATDASAASARDKASIVCSRASARSR